MKQLLAFLLYALAIAILVLTAVMTLAPPESEPSVPLHAIEGVVVDDLGHAVPHFFIEASRGEDDEERPGTLHLSAPQAAPDVEAVSYDYSESTGQFRLRGLTSGEWSIRATGEGDRCSEPAVAVPSGQDLTLVMPRSCDLEGEVVDGERSPVPNVSLYLAHHPNDWPAFALPSEPACLTDAAGRFRIRNRRPGDLILAAVHPDHCGFSRVSMEPGTVQSMTVRVGPAGEVVGTLAPSLGTRSDRTVRLLSFNGFLGWQRTRSNPGGEFRFSDVLPQDSLVDVPGKTGSERARVTISVREGETVRVELGSKEARASR